MPKNRDKALSALSIPVDAYDPALAAERIRNQRADLGWPRWPTSCTVICDTREQAPFKFPGSIRGTLKTGDYSVQDCQEIFCIERKSLSDAWSSIGSGRGPAFARRRRRFRAEWERMGAMRFAAVVIEGNLEELTVQPEQSQVDPSKVICTYISWSLRYGVGVWFCSNRALAQRMTGRLLVGAWELWRGGEL